MPGWLPYPTAPVRHGRARERRRNGHRQPFQHCRGERRRWSQQVKTPEMQHCEHAGSERPRQCRVDVGGPCHTPFLQAPATQIAVRSGERYADDKPFAMANSLDRVQGDHRYTAALTEEQLRLLLIPVARKPVPRCALTSWQPAVSKRSCVEGRGGTAPADPAASSGRMRRIWAPAARPRPHEGRPAKAAVLVQARTRRAVLLGEAARSSAADRATPPPQATDAGDARRTGKNGIEHRP